MWPRRMPGTSFSWITPLSVRRPFQGSFVWALTSSKRQPKGTRTMDQSKNVNMDAGERPGPRRAVPQQSKNQKALATSREGKGSGAFGASDSDPSKAGIRQLSPSEFEGFHGNRVPPRTDIPVAKKQTDPVNDIAQRS